MKCGHQCDACHKASDAQAKKIEIKVIIVSCKYWGMEFFLFVFFVESRVDIYIGVSSLLLTVGIFLMVALFL